MKFKLKLTITLIAFILFVGFFFMFSNPEEEPEGILDIRLDEVQDEQTTLFWSEVDFNEIHLVNGDENDEVILQKDKQGNWDTAQPLPEKVNLNKLDQAVSIIFSLSGHSKEAKLSADDIFTGEEERSITLLNQSGIKEKLTIGTKNDDETFYYVKPLESDDIYQVSVQLIDALPFHQEDLFDRSIIQITSEQVQKIEIYNGTETIVLAPHSPYSQEETMEHLSGWYMHGPYEHVIPVNYNRMSHMIFGIKDIEWIEKVNNFGDDLEENGLTDPPLTITFMSENNEETILIGAPATNQSYYAKLVDHDQVFTVDNRSLLPYSFQAFDLIDHTIQKISIDVLKQLEINTENEQIVLTVDHESGAEPIFEMNDQPLDLDNFGEIYETITELAVDRAVDDAVYHRPEISMTYLIIDTITEEKEINVEFVHYDEAYYAVFLEEKADFLIKKSNVLEALEGLNKYVE